MSNKLQKSDIHVEEGKQDIAYVHADVDMEQLRQAEDAEKALEKQMAKKGLEWENAELVGVFEDEFSLHLLEKAKIILEGEIIYDG